MCRAFSPRALRGLEVYAWRGLNGVVVVWFLGTQAETERLTSSRSCNGLPRYRTGSEFSEILEDVMQTIVKLFANNRK
jgi:hypothetical protein